MQEWKTCCFTGHRPNRLPWKTDESDAACLYFKAVLALEVERAYREGYRRFLTGMAQGADLICAEAVMACQTVHPEIQLNAVIPCLDQTKGWSKKQKQRYQSILDWIGINGQILVQQERTRDCMLRRDRYMVNQSQRIIAIYDGKSRGGTGYTLGYAMEKKLETVIIDPFTMTIVR